MKIKAIAIVLCACLCVGLLSGCGISKDDSDNARVDEYEEGYSAGYEDGIWDGAFEGIKDFALETFGPMAFPLFEEWGVHKTEDFGQIVFNLIQAQALRKTEDDKIEDFAGGFDFYQALVVPFLPEKKK